MVKTNETDSTHQDKVLGESEIVFEQSQPLGQRIVALSRQQGRQLSRHLAGGHAEVHRQL